MVDILASAEGSKLGKLGTAEQLDERDQKCEEGMLDMMDMLDMLLPKTQSKELRRPGVPSKTIEFPLSKNNNNVMTDLEGTPGVLINKHII